ncbi:MULTISPECIES: hypothetical protein [unclassified Brevibacterium]|uniref:hypothetical protein n=1 Tax=unclassified Brevibacterium TaxID=2614124 RepID=UPI0010F5F1E2|nr:MULTISPECIES: hypothetical protein [unclassified Brevibacterium]MCM1012749.1 hypothetical protein [Brevibacterium sp. XM4083]
MTDAEHTTPPEPPTPRAPTPTPTPGAPTPTSPPTPCTVNKDVPTEAWRANLTETAEAPAADRHARISDLLDDLEGQVGSL